MKPSILFVLHLPPPTHGASMVGKYIHDSALVRSLFDADFVNLTTSTALNATGNIVKGTLSIQWRVLRALRRKRYDLCYVTLNASGKGFYKDLAIVMLLKLFRVPLIYHFHNKGVAGSGKKALYRFAFRKASVILLSDRLYPDIAEYVPRERVSICPNGVPASPVVSAPGPGFRMLFLSNMMASKGVYVLLEACALLRDLDFRCDFVGAWSDVSSADFESSVERLGLTGKIKAHGKQYGPDKEAFFRQADVFVFPTFYHNECLPLVLLEAMQAGLPVISTPEGAIADVVLEGVTGLLVPQRDAVALSTAIRRVFSDAAERQRMGGNGRERYEAHFTMEKFETTFTDILKRQTHV
ncbi:MAG TPA: glycosyltransferase family 4 protein [Dinghuibacter sp.]|uniref:glycosyltransferase family 4 protein n=1 Tax=Dinghuibacter sp. TaxID=2024697 RepID=UPI002BFE987F|nr:glycosyltransferase family 4 protein [Dinghuibacter sp.]HTJ11365.1 glycosyltransferase family 4 protein [Dinghuibacter sp.]